MNTPSGPRPLVVVGASVRAIAASAARAGWSVHAADLFGDHDLRAVAVVVRTIHPYPAGLPAAIAGFPPSPWLYTGALENHPRLIAAVAGARPLAGCSAVAVAAVRDPARLAAALHGGGLSFPETRDSPAGLPADGTWLIKPLASAGGRGIRRWQGGDALPTAEPGRHLWQRLVPGRAWAAGYLLAADTVRLVATSRQLLGRRWCRAGRFAYCGSVDVDPASLPPAITVQLDRLGRVLASAFGLVGLVGVDLVIDDLGHVHVIEVNPRPSASLELVERATGLSLAAAHLAACGLGPAPAPTPSPAHDGRSRRTAWTKAILFAAHDLPFIEATLTRTLAVARPWSEADGWPAVADIPEPPQAIPAGSPICTVFAPGPAPAAALKELRRRVTTVAAAITGGDQRLTGTVPERGLSTFGGA
jgi:predicted ATP-grasp superfamily ATP-dependent carboligase